MVVEEMGKPEDDPSGPRRLEKRGQRSIKHEKMTDELWSLAQLAAKRLGVGVNEWVCDVMRSEAERQLGEDPPPPTRDALAEIIQRLDAIERSVAGGAPDGGPEPTPRPRHSPPEPSNPPKGYPDPLGWVLRRRKRTE